MLKLLGTLCAAGVCAVAGTSKTLGARLKGYTVFGLCLGIEGLGFPKVKGAFLEPP